MSKKRRNQIDNVNQTNDEINDVKGDETEMTEKKSIGTKFGEVLHTVKEAKATKVVVGVVATTVVAAAAYIAGKKGFPNGSDDELDPVDVDDSDNDISEEPVTAETDEN